MTYNGNINEFKLNEIFEQVKYYHISNPIQTQLNSNKIPNQNPIKFQYNLYNSNLLELYNSNLLLLRTKLA
jgi:hypothetical protein